MQAAGGVCSGCALLQTSRRFARITHGASRQLSQFPLRFCTNNLKQTEQIAHASTVATNPAVSKLQVNAAAVEAPAAVDWEKTAAELDLKSPLEIMDHALATFGNEIAIAFSGAEDVALIEYAHLTGRPYRVFRWVQLPAVHACSCHCQSEAGTLQAYQSAEGGCSAHIQGCTPFPSKKCDREAPIWCSLTKGISRVLVQVHRALTRHAGIACNADIFRRISFKPLQQCEQG